MYSNFYRYRIPKTKKYSKTLWVNETQMYAENQENYHQPDYIVEYKFDNCLEKRK